MWPVNYWEGDPLIIAARETEDRQALIQLMNLDKKFIKVRAFKIAF